MVQLQQLELEGFGKFDKKTKIDFGGGINFINGPNEAGKSTILEAILASLFKYTTRNIKPYFSWQNGDVCRLKLSYINDNNEVFQIISDYKNDKKELKKINGSRTSLISSKKTTIHNKVKEHFGFDEQKVFENTTFIRQSQMAILAKRDETVNKLKDMVEEVLVGTAEASATKSLKKLKKAVKDFNKKLDQLKKQRETLAQDLQDAEEKNSDAVKDSEQHKDVSEKLPKKEKELSELEERKRNFDAKEELEKEHKNLKKKSDELKRALVNIDTEIKKRDKIKDKLKNYKGFDSLSEKDFSRIKKIFDELNTSNNKSERLKKAISMVEYYNVKNGKLNKDIQKYKGHDTISEESAKEINRLIKEIGKIDTSLEAYSKSGIKKQITRERLDPLHLVLFIVGLIFSLVLIGIPLAIYAFKNMKKEEVIEETDDESRRTIKHLGEERQKLKEKLDGLAKEIPDFNMKTFAENHSKYLKINEDINNNRNYAIKFVQNTLDKKDIDNISNEANLDDLMSVLSEEKHNVDQEIKQLNEELKDITKLIKDFDPHNFVDSYNDYIALKKQIEGYTNTIHTLVRNELEENEITKNEDENIKKVEYKKADVLDELTKVENSLKEYKLINITDKEIKQLENLQKEVKELNNKKVELEANAKTYKKLVKDPEDLKEQLDTIDNHTEELQEKSEEHQLAADFLEKAEQEVQQKFTPAIQSKSKPILKKITNKKYSDIKINEENMNIVIKAPEINDFVPVDSLSQGAKDQVYFTIRTAMTDLLSGDINIPLIFDDPFHNFDDVRLKETIDAVKEIAQKKQIILISHKNYQETFNNFADNLIEVK